MKEYAKHFYKSKAWQRTRYAYIVSRQGQCERCGAGGKIVHHKIYIDPTNIYNEAITLNHDNLELLCQDCHNKEHMGNEATTKGTRFDDNGQLIQR
jgi:5-methylcytosine-specific restriction endonuclease McrA